MDQLDYGGIKNIMKNKLPQSFDKIIEYLEKYGTEKKYLSDSLFYSTKDFRYFTLAEAIQEMKNRSRIGLSLLRQYKLGFRYMNKIRK